MHIWQAIKMAMKSLWTNKLRSFLTMLGIIIGVMTVSLLTTVAQGVSNAVVSSIREQSTLAVLMNMTQRMTYSEADSIIKEVQPDDINAEDYFDYSLVLNSSSATTYQSIDGVSEDYENYLLYEKLYDFSPEELKKLEPQEQLVATALMSKRKRAPTETSIMVVPANFTTVYKLDIDGNFPKENNEVLVDRKFVKYYFKNEDYLGAIGKTISFGVTYKTQIKIKLTNPLNQNEDIYEKICNFLVGKFGTGKFIDTKTGKPVSKKAEPAVSGIEEFVDVETGEPVDSKNVEEICIGANLKILKNVDGKDYAFDEENQTLVIDTEFTESYKDLIDKNSPEIPTTGDETSFVQDLMKIDSIQGLILYSSLFTGATEITKDDVSVAEIYSSENAKTFTVCGVLTDKNESLFVGTASIGETSDKVDGTEKLDLAALMGAMQSTRGTAYVLQSDETLKSVGINAKRVSDATIFYAYFRYKTEDVVDDSVSKISIAFLQSRYMIMSDFMMISMSSVANIISRVMEILTIMLTVISIISLVVGGIGIMNIMLVAVTERTREIGIRKAIGAKKSSILVQFLIEALMLSIVGGAIGLVISAIASAIIGSVMGVSMAMPFWVIAMSIGFCTAIGLIFGMFPAVKASNMQPIDALRRE